MISKRWLDPVGFRTFGGGGGRFLNQADQKGDQKFLNVSKGEEGPTV